VVDRTCRDISFPVISCHHIAPEMVEEAREVARSFFDLPLEEKLRVAQPAPNVSRGEIATYRRPPRTRFVDHEYWQGLRQIASGGAARRDHLIDGIDRLLPQQSGQLPWILHPDASKKMARRRQLHNAALVAVVIPAANAANPYRAASRVPREEGMVLSAELDQACRVAAVQGLIPKIDDLIEREVTASVRHEPGRHCPSITGKARPLTSLARAAPGVEDIAAIAELRPGVGRQAGDKAARIDDEPVSAHRMGFERLDQPVLADALGGAVIVLSHHRAGARAVEKRVRPGRGEAFAPVGADASGQRDQAEKDKRTHRIGPGLWIWTSS
jgi:hypothetical protein